MKPSVQSTLTFLFTDVEQSSPLWDRRPEQMRVAMAFHDHVMAQVIERHAGQLFRKTGDGICACFANPGDALRTGVKVQAALQNMPGEIVLSVRMAIHTGSVHERDGDYDGEPLNRLARILAFAQGGQILLSSAAAALVAPANAEDITLRQLGTHSLRGLSVDETIFQVLHPSLSTEAPSIASTRSTGRLPVALNSFVGRSEQIAHLVLLMERSRLVTLVGPGGIGKTRLAVEAASRCSTSFEYGTWFIDLQNVVDPDKVVVAVASAFGIRESLGYGLIDAIRDRLGSRSMLLVVDNCEQVQTAAADAIRTILDMAPRVHVLATSREVLGLRGERVFRVAPLTVPSDDDSKVAGGTEAVRLFVDRALYANPGFRVTNENLHQLCRLTQRLDGIPLAIELAAARMRAMSLDQLVKRLDDLFSVLKSSFRDQMPRHQTLLATMDWSFRLLAPEERTLFTRLGVFAGTWSDDICEEVAGSPPLQPEEMLDLLAGLVDKSLVIAEERRGEMRYRLLETVRAYARSQLAEAEDAQGLYERFFTSMLSLASRLDAGILGHEQLRLRRLFDFELDNFRSAIDWGLAQAGRIEDVATLVCRLAQTWLMNGDFSEASAYFERIAPRLPEESYEIRARVEILSGTLRLRAGDRRGLELMRHAVGLAEKANDQVYADSLGKFAAALFEHGEVDEGELLFKQLAEMLRQKPHLPEGHLPLALGVVATERGDLDGAMEHYRLMLERKRAVGDRRGEGLALSYMAHVEAIRGSNEAEQLYRDAISFLAELPDYYALAINLGAASSTLIPTSPEHAAQVQGYADHLVDRVEAILDRHVSALVSRAKDAATKALTVDRYTEWYQDGKLLELDAILQLFGCRPVSPAESAPDLPSIGTDW